MRKFIEATAEPEVAYDRSICIAKSGIQKNDGESDRRWVASAATRLERDREIDVLNLIYQHRNLSTDREEGPNPIKKIFTRGILNRLDNENDPYFEKIFGECLIDLSDNILCILSEVSDEQDFKGVSSKQWAILTDELVEDPSEDLIIVTGKHEQAQPYVEALSYIRAVKDFPAITNCVQASIYYPTSLLSRLVSYHIAQRADRNIYGELDFTSNVRSGNFIETWENVVSRDGRQDIQYQPLCLPTGRGENEAERIYCWMQGIVSINGDESRVDVNRSEFRRILNKAKQAAEHKGYTGLTNFFIKKRSQIR